VTERVVAKLFRAHRLTGWRRHLAIVGRPDFAFSKQRLAVFVDGCFWHGCPRHLRMPATNQAYWGAKIARNRARDVSVTEQLRVKGWRVLRVWEHELADGERIVKRILRLLDKPPGTAKHRSAAQHGKRTL
jgi:DNA mismatch endonuclease (patch repair protein)